MPTWPETLPQRFLRGTVSETLPDNVMRTSMDTGPAKTRRRTTANTAPLSGAMAMTHAQWAALVTFYQDTLSSVLPFDMPQPFDAESTHSVRFTAPPSKTDFSPARVRVQLELEVMPS